MAKKSYILKQRVVNLLVSEEEKIKSIQPLGFNCIVITQEGSLYEIDLNSGVASLIMTINQENLLWEEPISIHVSKDNKLAAIVNTYGLNGVVIDLEQGSVLLKLVRGGYHCNHCIYPIAFFERNQQTYLIHGTDWNRLDITNPRTGELITERIAPASKNGLRDEHYLDYFHSNISVSPDQKWVIDNGWIWHPFGDFTALSIDKWLGNVWESEDGPSKKSLWWGMDDWNNSICWLDDGNVAILGKYEFDLQDVEVIDAYVDTVRIFNIQSGMQVHSFAGPIGKLIYDGLLFAYSENDGFAAWSIESGGKVFQETDFCPTLYHPNAKRFLTLLADNSLQITQLQY